jgi:hypothetical protein
MAPTTRSSAKKSAHTDERDMVSWTSDVSGGILYYERLYVLEEEEAEVTFVQLRMTDGGELVPYTKDNEDGTTKIHMDDDETVTDETQKMKTLQSPTAATQRMEKPTQTSSQK